jgi:methanogenic corrinoid protein MtbC1
MTTEIPEKVDRRLAEHILKGDSAQAGEIAQELLRQKENANDIVDTISDTMNIVADLHEVERYSADQVENCERAAEKALETIRPGIRVEQSKISGKVMVTSLQGDSHSFDKTMLLAMLEIAGFTTMDGGTDLTAEEVAAKVHEFKPDILAVPLVSSAAADSLVYATSLIGLKKSGPRVIAYGRRSAQLGRRSGLEAVEPDSMAALSKIAELLIAKP